MHLAKATLKGASPYSQGRYHDTEKMDKELHDAYEKRTWREKLHYNDAGIVYIPRMSFKLALAEAAKYLSVQIPGKGKSTYTKHFEAGIMVADDFSLNVHKDDVSSEAYFVPSDGMRGGSRRVIKYFPVINEWEGEIGIYILDPTITKEVLKKHLEEAGKFIGIGRFRPRNNGFYGRFTVEDLTWTEV